MLSFHCASLAPAWLCSQRDIVVYLLPSASLALLIGMLTRIHPFFFLFTLAGTVCHELAHWLVGAATGARPGALTIVPRRVHAAGRTHWRLGAVTLTRVTWYNAAPAALAPLAILLVPLAVAWWRTRDGWHFAPVDVALAFLLAPQFLSFWPSAPDWRIAARSLPALLLLLAGGAALLYWQPGLFQLVKS